MKTPILLLLFLLLCACQAPVTTPLPNTNTESDSSLGTLVHYSGRFTDDGQFAWSGSNVSAQFVGTSISVLLSRGYWPERMVAEIDGQKGIPFDVSGSTRPYLLAKGLTNGLHTAKVTRRNEAFFDVTQFLGFEVGDGELVASDAPLYSHRLLILGDSITAGYGDTGVSGTCHLDTITEDETVAYPNLLAGMLDADLQVVAYAGKGMYRNTSGSTVNQIPVLFERTLADDPTSVWDQTRYTPDIIVINLGTNDGYLDDPGQPFEDAYVAFLGRLRGLFPEAKIYCTLGPMIVASYVFTHIQNVVATVNDANIHYAPIDSIDPSDGYGCDGHPNAITHQKMAEQIFNQLQ